MRTINRAEKVRRYLILFIDVLLCRRSYVAQCELLWLFRGQSRTGFCCLRS